MHLSTTGELFMLEWFKWLECLIMGLNSYYASLSACRFAEIQPDLIDMIDFNKLNSNFFQFNSKEFCINLFNFIQTSQ